MHIYMCLQLYIFSCLLIVYDVFRVQEMEYQVFDILSLWTPVFSRDPENQINKEDDLSSAIRLET